MKFLLLLFVVLAVLWLARSVKRRTATGESQAPPPAARETMVACAHCGLHLPGGDALPGRGGLFCSEAHRTAYEQTHG